MKGREGFGEGKGCLGRGRGGFREGKGSEGLGRGWGGV